MSDVTPILSSVVDIKRFTASVLDGQVVVSSINGTRNPGRSGSLEVTLQGCTYAGTGTVKLNGNVSETLSFTGDGVKVSVKNNYSTFAGVSLSNISGGTISVRAVSDMGQPINQPIVVAAGLSVRFFQNVGFMKGFEAGQQVVGSNRIRMGMMLEPNANIAANDFVYGDYGIVGITLMYINFFEAVYDFAGATHHIEAWLSAI